MIRSSSLLLKGSSPYVIEVDSDLIGFKILKNKMLKLYLNFIYFFLRSSKLCLGFKIRTRNSKDFLHLWFFLRSLSFSVLTLKIEKQTSTQKVLTQRVRHKFSIGPVNLESPKNKIGRKRCYRNIVYFLRYIRCYT